MEYSKNAKAIKSQRIIYKALRRILLKKNLDDVSVSELIDEAGVSRSTFYRNFNTVHDPLNWAIDFYYNEYLENKKGKENQILFFYEYWDDHKDLITIISKSNNSILKEVMKKYSSSDADRYMIDLKCSIMASLISTWALNPERETPVQMEKKTKDLLKDFIDLGF